ALHCPNTSTPGDGSRTVTIITAPSSEDKRGSSSEGTLKLCGSTRKPCQKVLWREDVVDNEGAGKKSSKICCIYHKPKAFDESSDEDDSPDETSDSSSHRAHEHEH
ncbi:phosphatase inhibitor-domain-containing protein, partial [Rhodocollybia butyracea]